MITAEHTFAAPVSYPLKRLGQPEKLLFFDIETTGFSGDTCQVYLIGCISYCKDRWHLIQWFADTSEAEKDVLTAFFRFTAGFSCLVHFNGDSFDIPFLLKRSRAWDLPCSLSSLASVDIYRRIRPFKDLLGLDSLKQKSVEQFLGIFRQDPYSGGQLIDAYRLYLGTRQDSLYHMLMLHNREDLEGMPLILPILYYTDLPRQDLALKGQELKETPDIFGDLSVSLRLTLENPDPLPVPVMWDTPHAACQACGHCLELTVPLVNGPLKYFYPDYKDYYYLIYEDTAVHKSVGEYVERKARRQATAQTCYTKKEGLFLAQPDALWTPVFRKSHKSRQAYARYSPDLFLDRETLGAYIRYLLDL